MLTPLSSISSFSRMSPSAVRERKGVPAVIPKNPPLDLRPLKHIKPSMKNQTSSTPYSAESESPAKLKKTVTAESSLLLMEIQERIAKHGSTQSSSRDKVAKLNDQAKNAVKNASSSSSRIPLQNPVAAKTKEKPAPKPKEVKSAKGKGKKKERVLITPQAYVQSLMDKVAVEKATTVAAADDDADPGSEPRKGCRDFLARKHIIYVATDLNYASETSQRRMDIVRPLLCNLFAKIRLNCSSAMNLDGQAWRSPDEQIRP